MSAPEQKDRPHISASAMNTYLDCGERYRRRYIEKDIIPPGIAMIRGTAVHLGAEHNFKQKIESHADLPKEQIIEAAIAGFEGRIKADGLMLSQEEESVGQDKIVGAAKDEVVSLTGLFAEQAAPEYQPVMVEEKLRIILSNAPRDLLAILDLADDKDRVTDFKTGKRAKPQAEWDASPQLGIQALTFKAKTGRFPKEIRVEQLVATKVPKRIVAITERTTADFKPLVARINTVVSGIEAGMFMPANTSWWGCSPKWCGYYRTCPYVNSERKAAAEGKE